MSTDLEPAPPVNDPVAKSASPALIRRLNLQEDARERLMNRHLPAWVISGAVHVVLILGMVVLYQTTDTAAKPKDDRLVEATLEEEKAEKPDNFDNPDVGFDAELPAATESERVEADNVEAPTNNDEPVGSSPDAPDAARNVLAPPGFNNPETIGGVAADPTGTVRAGEGGAAGHLLSDLAKGRSGATKNALLRAGGGNTKSEASVAKGLIWLKKVQLADGRWQYDGARQSDHIAATGMALLPFLAAGQTHRPDRRTGQKGAYIETVDKGVKFLLSRQEPSGTFKGSSGMYAHAIAAIALCEAFGMTEDPKLKVPAQQAINYVVRAQATDGSWGYGPKAPGDTSIVGWQIQALKSGKLAGLTVPDEPFKKASTFLDSVSVRAGDGSGYGYRNRGQTPNLTAVGLLCRQYMGWGPKKPDLQIGVEWMIKNHLPNRERDLKQKQLDNTYYYYYATQVVHFFGGPAWSDTWNPVIRDLVIDLQEKDGANAGSWAACKGQHFGDQVGRLGSTCLAILTLEVYYRHLPLYKRDSSGLAELER